MSQPQTNISMLYPLKSFPGILRGYAMGTLARNKLKETVIVLRGRPTSSGEWY